MSYSIFVDDRGSEAGLLFFMAILLACLGLPRMVLGQDTASSFIIAQNSQAQTSVVVAADARERTRQAANELAMYLGRMTGATFKVETGDGSRGIVVGVVGDFDSLPVASQFSPADLTQQEAYLLHSTPDCLYVVGASELAVENAVWDLLHRLGHRQFFPGKNWEIVPSLPRIEISIQDRQKPDFIQRTMKTDDVFHPDDWLGQWQRRNRVRSGFNAQPGRFFWSFYRAHRDVLERNPQFLALDKGSRSSNKLCLSNPELRKLMIAHAIASLKHDRALRIVDMTPMSPRAGWDWCECADCASIGRPADNLLAVANVLAEHPAIIERDAYISILASDAMIPAPKSVRPHRRVAVNIEMPGVLSTDYDDLQQGQLYMRSILGAWRAQGAENLGVVTTLGGPTQMTDPTLAGVESALPFLREQGVNRIWIDIGVYWGNIGLIHYLNSWVLWDISQAQHLDALLDDFFTRSFGQAEKPMRRFFEMLSYANRHHPMTLDAVFSLQRTGQMYELLHEAMSLAESPEIRARLGDMAIYTRTLELQVKLLQADKDQHQALSKELMQFAYQTRDSGMVHLHEMFNHPTWYGVTGGKDTGLKVPEGKNPWKPTQVLTDSQITALITDGFERYRQRNAAE